MQRSMRGVLQILPRLQSLQASAIREGLPCLGFNEISWTVPALLEPKTAFHTTQLLAKSEGGSESKHPSGPHVKDNKAAPKRGQATGAGSSQVEQDRTGGKPQAGGPKPTEHGTLPRPGIPSREDSTGREGTRPRTGTTGDDEADMRPGGLPPGYDPNKPRAATETQQMATDEMQGKKQTIGFLGRDPTKDTSGGKPDYGAADPNKSEEDLMQGGSRRPEKGQVGNYGDVDSGEMAGMPREQKPPSTSPKEHHSHERQDTGRPNKSQSWEPFSNTPSLDKDARVKDPRKSGQGRADVSPRSGPSEGEPEPGSYAEELSKNVVVDGTPKGPQEVPPKVPGAIDPNQPNFRD